MPTILITGAAGFIGQLLATHLLTVHPTAPDNKLILTDIIEPPIPSQAKYPQNVQTIQADLCNASSLSSLLSTASIIDTIFIFHGIMSSGSEQNFSLGMTVNLHSTLSLLEGIRTSILTQTASPLQASGKRNPKPVRVIYASSLAVYGRPLPSTINETTHPTPESSYGAQKLACETLIQDYIRRGYITGLCLRFPSISIRPGAPTAAASSFLSGMIREPMRGKECVIPICDRGFMSWMCSPRKLVENLVWAGEMDFDLEELKLDTHRRVVNLPGKGASVQEMLDALVAVGGEEKLKFIREVEDEGTVKILRSWGVRYDNAFALGLGFKEDRGFEQAVRDYVDGLEG
ncbi:putative nucleoside-diphosphate-sugar epimerase [Sclerotinia borealis F-4128]|uniref:Putative nucleoside-diphosphate-sugar epimerase n=1 Tax=Sclerotinia borealis (strain F-4128) TaxID=1432307 RepID=W9CIL1_SCLBF|nr:putative nucleoside-diphosphate-sugar epimerase [Sclerotinia borealis F-4128]